MYHAKKAMTYDRLHYILKYTKLWSPALIFLWFLIPNYFIVIPIICVVALVSWLGEVKTRSLRNINLHASEIFKFEDEKEKREYLRKMFR